MTPEERLAAIAQALESVAITCLVMGGHAVRFYGLERYTNDFDFTLAPNAWDDLAEPARANQSFSERNPCRRQ